MGLIRLHSARRIVLFHAGLILALCVAHLTRRYIHVPEQDIYVLWPSYGVAVAALLATHHRFWPGVLVLAFIGEAAFGLGPLFFQYFFAASAEIGTYMGLVLLSCWLLRRRYPQGLRLHVISPDLRDFIFMSLLLGFAGALIEPLKQTVFFGQPFDYELLQKWFLADATSVLVFAPALLSWSTRPANYRSLRSPDALLELSLLGLAFALLYFIGIGADDVVSSVLDLPEITLPLFLWAVIRFDLRVISALLALSSLFVAAEVAQGSGPFTSVSDDAVLQSMAAAGFLSLRAAIFLIISALLATTIREQARYRQAQGYLDELVRTVGALFWVYDIREQRYAYTSRSVRAHWVDPSLSIDDPDAWIDRIHPDDQARVRRTWHLLRNGTLKIAFNISYRVVDKYRSERWVRHIGFPITNDKSEVERFMGVVFDVTEDRRDTA